MICVLKNLASQKSTQLEKTSNSKHTHVYDGSVFFYSLSTIISNEKIKILLVDIYGRFVFGFLQPNCKSIYRRNWLWHIHNPCFFDCSCVHYYEIEKTLAYVKSATISSANLGYSIL